VAEIIEPAPLDAVLAEPDLQRRRFVRQGHLLSATHDGLVLNQAGYTAPPYP
jgi:hypothetical protein